MALAAAADDLDISQAGQYVTVTPFVTVIMVGGREDEQSSIVIVTMNGVALEFEAVMVGKDDVV